MQILRTYEQLCTPVHGGDSWLAVRGGPESPGPFQRAWEAFMTEQRRLAEMARRKESAEIMYPTLWRTMEVNAEMQALVGRRVAIVDNAEGNDDASNPRGHDSGALTAAEYFALDVINTAATLQARSEKPKRQIDQDQQVVEAVSYTHLRAHET